MRKSLSFCFFVLFFATTVHAEDLINADAKPLRVDEAFILSGQQADANTYLLNWWIAPDYYLYKTKFALSGASAATAKLELSQNDVEYSDIFFGEQRVYYQFVDGQLSSAQSLENIIISYQGCWEGGICYPVQSFQLQNGQFKPVALNEDEQEYSPVAAPMTLANNYYVRQLQQASPAWVLLLFFLAGIGLTLTPCVLPMLPIVTSIISDKRASNLRRRTSLLLVYVLSLASVFSLLGLFSSWLGYAMRQLIASPPVLIILALLVVLLGCSLLNPMRWSGLTGVAQRINPVLNMTAGTYTGAALWGGLSPLIVGSCLSAPLAAALLYLAERGDPLFGALTLFTLALGMSIPLLLVGLGLGQFVPRTGPWLARMRSFFALLLFALAVFILSSLLPAAVEVLLYSMLAAAALLNFFLRPYQTAFSAVTAGIFAMMVYILLPSDNEELQFTEVRAEPQLTAALQAAVQQEQPALVYYAADWCISCRELEWRVFTNKKVQNRLDGLALIKVDVTRNNRASRQLLNRFDALGPPTVFFIDKSGVHRPAMTLIGTFNPDHFMASLDALNN